MGVFNKKKNMFKIETHRELSQITTYQDSSLNIMKWGQNNSFPQSLKNLVEQSPTAKPAVERTASFLKGASFFGDDVIISPYGLTIGQLVSHMANNYALFNAFALHCNFNIEGKVTSIIPIDIEDLRFNSFDELNYASKLGYFSNYGSNSEVKKTINTTVTRDKIKWIHRYNFNAVLPQIEALGEGEGLMEKRTSGISKYKGQILYHSEAGHSSYPISRLQAPVNYVLADVENSILMRKETATGFMNSYLLKTTMSSEESDLIALESAIDDAQGVRGAGKVVTMSGLSPEEVGSTVLEEIGKGATGQKDIVETISSANDLIERKIYGAFLIPPVLAGRDNTGFSEANLRDAYFVFNAVTQGGRDVIEKELNRILKNSIFSIKEIKLQKLKLDSDQKQEG